MFYSAEDNSFSTRGFPWAWKITEDSVLQKYDCGTCGIKGDEPAGDITVLLERNKGIKWPDVLGCGSEPLFMVSKRVLADWRSEGVAEQEVYKVKIAAPLPKRLEGTKPPEYYWIKGKMGAKMDFDASGFVDVKFCPECGNRTDDISSTYDKQHGKNPAPYVFLAGTWSGADLFVTDMSDAAFFCTDRIIEIATKYSHTNFRFIPIEEGINAASRGLRYLKRKR